MKKLKIGPIAALAYYCLNFWKILAAFFLVFALSTRLFAQTADEAKLIAPELLQQDFRILKDSLQKLHAGLYTYKTKEQITELFNNCEAKLNDPMTLTKFYSVVRYLISSIEDGHTSGFLPPDFNKKLISQAKLFPLIVRFIGSKAYTICESEGLAAATEITAIDGHPVNELRKEFFTYIQSDGQSQGGKYAELNDGDSPLLYLYYLVYGEKSAFDIRFKAADGKIGNMHIDAKQFKDIACHPTPIPVTQYLKLAYQPGDVAIMTIKSFFNEKLDATHENLADFLQKSFKELDEKHIKKLIIDLRDNTGGNDGNGALLISYLTAKPFRYYASIETTTIKFETKDHDLLAIQQPHEDDFKGLVFMLINGKSFSATTDVAGIARQFANVKFIGEETGGGYYGNTSGARTTLYLPNTQIKVNIPLWKYKAAVKPLKYKDRGIIPDYPVTPTITDYIQHKDVQLDFALKLVKQH
jgi:C-terminal processing protease CtpA/Prc